MLRPSGVELKIFDVMGSIRCSSLTSSKYQVKEDDIALQLPFFSGNSPPGHDKVPYGQWLSAVEGARLTSSSQALHCWMQRSVREPADSLLRSVGVGAHLDKILSSLKLAYGIVFL